MCLIPLPYETRNLGLECFAVSEAFMESPAEEILLQSLRNKQLEFGKIFVQARVAKQHLRTAKLFERTGFYFVEATVFPHTILSKNVVLDGFVQDKKRYLPKRYMVEELEFLTSHKPDESTLQDIKAIAEESFIDDRFHLDENCEPEAAGRRYSFWVEDMARDAATTFHLLRYQQKSIAFFTRRKENLLLAGFTPQFTTSGLGEFLWLSVMEKMRGEGVGYATTVVSVNNLLSLNLHARLGFKLKNPSTTFHYWSDCQS